MQIELVAMNIDADAKRQKKTQKKQRRELQDMSDTRTA